MGWKKEWEGEWRIKGEREEWGEWCYRGGDGYCFGDDGNCSSSCSGGSDCKRTVVIIVVVVSTTIGITVVVEATLVIAVSKISDNNET